jgi:glyoxylase-like metal-dependent hydrolase (beta-lactamase superfamily II)
MKIGKYTIHVIETGIFSLDGGAMFGIIPKPIWEKEHIPDDKNRIKMSLRTLLLVSDNRKILVDTGMGNKWNDKLKSIYKIDNTSYTLEKSLLEKGFSKEEITDVFLTHLHFDHAGGATEVKNGKILPSFPNAKYYVQKNNLAWALNATERDKGSYIEDNFIPLVNEGVLNLLDKKDKYFDDELEIIVVNGHTNAQQLLRIFDTSQTLFYSGDLFPFASHIHLPAIMGYDLQPLITLQEKKEILPIAVEENWKIFFEHDFTTLAATVKKNDKGFGVDEIFKSI